MNLPTLQVLFESKIVRNDLFALSFAIPECIISDKKQELDTLQQILLSCDKKRESQIYRIAFLIIHVLFFLIRYFLTNVIFLRQKHI